MPQHPSKEEHSVQRFGDPPGHSTSSPRAQSPWSDMASSSGDDGDLDSQYTGRSVGQDSQAKASGRQMYEQKVYIDTNVEVLVRIHTAIKRSGHKFRNKRADEALHNDKQIFRHILQSQGQRVALVHQTSQHEIFRQYLTRLVLGNVYTNSLVRRLEYNLFRKHSLEIDPLEGRSPNVLVIIVLRAYLRDPARLSIIQKRLSKANIVRRNRLTYAGFKAKSGKIEALSESSQVGQIRPLDAHQEVQSPATNLPISPADSDIPVGPTPQPEVDDTETEVTRSYIAYPATDLASRFSISEALKGLDPGRSVATKMSALVRTLSYPKCPVQNGAFLCPYCSILLSKEYTRKDRWS